MSRTRESLRAAFVKLVLARRYDEIRIVDILAEADVGRSTFYEHFRSKEDLLRSTMDGMVHALARSAGDECDLDDLAGLLGHFWKNRRLGRVVFAPPLVTVLRRMLAECIENVLGEGRSSGDRVALRLAAVQIAAGQLALLHAWTTGEVVADAGQIARSLRATGRAARDPGWSPSVSR